MFDQDQAGDVGDMNATSPTRLRAVTGGRASAPAEPDMRIRVPKDVRTKLKLIAHLRGLPLHELTHELLETFCAQYRAATGHHGRSQQEEEPATVPQDETTTLRVTRELVGEVKAIAISRDESVFDLTTHVFQDYCTKFEAARNRPLLESSTGSAAASSQAKERSRR